MERSKACALCNCQGVGLVCFESHALKHSSHLRHLCGRYLLASQDTVCIVITGFGPKLLTPRLDTSPAAITRMVTPIAPTSASIRGVRLLTSGPEVVADAVLARKDVITVLWMILGYLTVLVPNSA